MAFTERFVATDATVGPFAIGFNYQDANNLKVVLMELDESNPQEITFSFAGTPSENQPAGTTVVLDTAYPSGKQLRIYKDIDLDTPRVDWQAGAVFNEETLNSMNVNLMEMAQTAYDAAERGRLLALEASNTLVTLEEDLAAQVAAAQAAAALADYWAQVALDAGSTANPEEAAAIARDAALAAQAAAEAARDLALSYRDTALTYRDTAGTHATNAGVSATAADASADAAAASAAAAQNIVDMGSLRWSGSLKFVATTDPDPLLGANGDFWFKRET